MRAHNDICAAIRGELPWFVGEDLDRERMAAVAAHLRQCLTCRQEAAALQQARNALVATGAGSMAAGGTRGVDEVMFSAMHGEITAAALAAADASGPGAGWRHGLWAAAALLLFGIGWQTVGGQATSPLSDRAPIPVPSARDVGFDGGEPLVLPWAGPRARMRPLDFTVDEDEDEVEASGEDGRGAGMLRRQRLRTLEEEFLLPHPRRD